MYFVILSFDIVLYLQVSKRDVDRFGTQSPPFFPSTLITISVDDSPSTVSGIDYSVPLKGVETDIMKICIVRSLTGSTGKNFHLLFKLSLILI